MKYYIAPAIVGVTAIAMTVFGMKLAHNMFQFASAVLLIGMILAYALAKSGHIPIPRRSKRDKGLSGRFVSISYTCLILLLAAFGHFWLALCWLGVGVFVFNIRKLREKFEESGA